MFRNKVHTTAITSTYSPTNGFHNRLRYRFLLLQDVLQDFVLILDQLVLFFHQC